MTCFQCGAGALREATVELEGTRHGETFFVNTPGLICDSCGFKTVDSEQSAEFTQAISDAYRSKHGLLTGTEIRDRRLHLGMTQQRFAEHLGTGIASIKRWESGQIQERAMDELIRLKTDPAAARRNLQKLEERVPEAWVVWDGEDITLTATLGERAQFSPRPKMQMEAVRMNGEDDFVADVCIAA